MREPDWIFDALCQLGDAADGAGMTRLTSMLELCMDVYIEEEQLSRSDDGASPSAQSDPRQPLRKMQFEHAASPESSTPMKPPTVHVTHLAS